jgi:hypothetical protein
MKTLALRARVFIHCFLVFVYPGETLAVVVHILGSFRFDYEYDYEYEIRQAKRILYAYAIPY